MSLNLQRPPRSGITCGGGSLSTSLCMTVTLLTVLFLSATNPSLRHTEKRSSNPPIAADRFSNLFAEATGPGARDPTGETLLADPVQACCMPAGECHDMVHSVCVASGGDPQGPGVCADLTQACRPLKWSQPPMLSPASP